MLNYLSKINADEKKKIVYLPTEMGCLKLTYYDNDMGALRKNFFFTTECLEKRYAEEKKCLDYYPFGMAMPGRTFSSNQYRYGFNGMEKDDEMGKGDGNSYTTEFRQYDPRIARWLSIDPMEAERVSLTPYNFVQNSPLLRVDPNGDLDDEIKVNVDTGEKTKVSDVGGDKVQIVTYTDNESHYLGSEVIEGSTVTFRETLGDFNKTTNYDSKTDNFSTSYSHSMAWWNKASGRVDYSDINVEDAIGVGILVKGGMKYLAKQTVKKSSNIVRSVGAANKGFSKVKVPSGFRQTNKFGYKHGQKVYKHKGKYYTRDIDSHNGGVWKVFEESAGRLKRIGTADASLKIFKN